MLTQKILGPWQKECKKKPDYTDFTCSVKNTHHKKITKKNISILLLDNTVLYTFTTIHQKIRQIKISMF